ncbi:hypothetical protein M0R72_15365 [Candidatus Pacearchaeota archaeon]|jgi:uncharacterized membrane protein|nr:hypothetical protein [Candidatus Pacearchaeota archaeon]
MEQKAFDTVNLQQAIILIGVVLLITLCTIFSQSAFMHLSLEANNGTVSEATNSSTYNQYHESYNFIYVIGLLLIIAVIVIAFVILRKSATS